MVDNTKSLRIVEVDILRGVAIILVILGHSFITNPVNIHDLAWGVTLRHWIYTFHMELFFVLAGVVYHCGNYGNFIRKKIDRILVPYLVFGMMAIFMHSSGIGAVNGKSTIGGGFINLLLHGGYYWFLYVLFIIFAIYPILESVLEKLWHAILLIAVLVFVDYYIELPVVFKLDSVIYHLPFFIIGKTMADYILRMKEMKIRSAIFTTLSMSVVYLVLDTIGRWGGDFPGLRFVRALSMMLLLFYLSVWMNNMRKQSTTVEKAVSFLETCSKYSLQLYLFNGFIMVPIRVFVCNILHIHIPIIIVLSIVLGNLIISIMVCHYILPRSKVLAYLCGVPSKPRIQ